MRFNLDRCIGIVAAGIAAFLLFSMQHTDPGDFIQNVINYNSALFWSYIITLLVAAVFLSIEKRKGETPSC